MGENSKPNFDNLNLSKLSSLSRGEQNKFTADVVKSARIILNDTKSQLLLKEKDRAKNNVKKQQVQKVEPTSRMSRMARQEI